MAKQKWCVRVVQTMTQEGEYQYEGGDLGSFVECLRYAGLVTVHETGPTLTTLCFDIHCPKGPTDKVWAEQNAERMRTFGYNAQAAPST